MADNIYMPFWERVKELVKLNRTTQEWVASASEIPFDTFRGWISKEVMPKAHQAQAIAAALNTTVEYLVTGRTGAGSAGDELMRLYPALASDLLAFPKPARDAKVAEIAVLAASHRAKPLGEERHA